MTKFFCTYCGQKLSAKESMLGTFVACPACKNSIEVPDFNKPQTNRFNTIPLSVPPPATPGGAIAAPATPVAVLPPPAAPVAALPPPEAPAPVIPEPEPIPEQPLPPSPAATLPPAAPIPAPATPAAALPPAVSVLSATPAVSAEQASAPAPPTIPSAPIPAPTYYPKPAEYTSPPAAPASALPPADPITAPAPAEAVPPPIPHFHQAPAAPVAQRKNPKLAALLSLIPGLGQMYNEQIIIGIILFILTPLLYLALPFGLALHIYLVIDARSSAARINAQPPGAPRLSLAIPPSHTWWMISIAAALAAAAILTLAGLVVSEVNQTQPDVAGRTTTRKSAATQQTTELVDIHVAKGDVQFSEATPDGWVPTKFHRLSIELPAKPQTFISKPPAVISNLVSLDQYDERKIRNSQYEFSLLHTTYHRAPNLQGASDGVVNGVSQLSSVSDFDYETEKTTLSGIPIAYVKMRYTLQNEPHLHHAIFIIDGHEMWSINIIGREKDIPDLWKRIRASIKIEEY